MGHETALSRGFVETKKNFLFRPMIRVDKAANGVNIGALLRENLEDTWLVRLRVFRNRGERGGTMIIFILSELIRVSRVRLRARKRRGKVIERILPRICAPITCFTRRRRFDSSITWSTNNEQRVACGEFIVEQRSFFPPSLLLVINVSTVTRGITPFVRNNTTIRFFW